MVDLSIVIVSWNVKDLLRRCLASIAQTSASLACEVFVVDNASEDGSPQMVASEFPHTILIANTANLGFTRGNNQALRRAQGRYALLLNPDAELTAGALQTMTGYLDAEPHSGVVGPQLVFPDGRIQSSRRRFPSAQTLFVESTILQRRLAQSTMLQNYYVKDRPDDATQDVDWLVGACLMVRRAAIEQVGLLDERFFMYSEEMDWCLRLKRAGWRVVYLPAARVIHHEAGSSEQVKAAQQIYFHSSKVAYAAKHFGRPQAEALRLFLLLTYLLQSAEEGLKWLLGHKRALRAQRLAAYRQVLRSGLRAYRSDGHAPLPGSR